MFDKSGTEAWDVVNVRRSPFVNSPRSYWIEETDGTLRLSSRRRVSVSALKRCSDERNRGLRNAVKSWSAFLEKALEDAINDDFNDLLYRDGGIPHRSGRLRRAFKATLLVDREDIEMIVKALKEVK